MKFVPSILLIIVALLFTSCSDQTNLAPASLKGKSISFYTSKISGEENQIFLHKNSIYSFKQDRTFEYSIEGKKIGGGSYSYNRSSVKNRALLIAIYSSSSGGMYSYEDELVFQDAQSGTWESTRTSDPAMTQKGGGTFKLLD